MKLGRLLFILPVSLISLIAAVSCSPKTTPSGEPTVSVTGDIPKEIPPGPTEFSWMTYDRKFRTIEDVRENIEKTMKEYGITGLSLMIKQIKWPQNTDSFLLNIGAENLGQDKTIDSGTAFRADRLGQPILAYIALQFATYRQFDIDKPLLEYLPKTSLANSPFGDLANDPRLLKLTTRSILSHQSGLPNSRKDLPENELRFILPPGKQFGYSEEAFDLLCFVLEKRFNLDINEIAKRLVFEPFKMKRSRFIREPPLNHQAASTLTFYTNAADFVEIMWLIRHGYYSLSRELKDSHMIYPSVAIRSPSILASADSDGRDSAPAGLSWCLGWGAYRLAGTSLGICNFMGDKERDLEYYTSIFESPNSLRNSTAIAIFIVTDKPKSFMPIVIEEFLGKIDTPLAWLGFN